MNPEAEFLKRMLPTHPDRAVEAARRFLHDHGTWAATLSLRQWEALRRLAPNAREYSELWSALEAFLENAAARAEPGQKWRAAQHVQALKAAVIEGSRPDGSEAANFYCSHLDLQPTKGKPRIDQVVRLRLAQRFLDVLVMEICRLVAQTQNAPETAAEQWFARYSDWAQPLPGDLWEQFSGDVVRAADPPGFVGQSLLAALRAHGLESDPSTGNACSDFAAAIHRLTDGCPPAEAPGQLIRFLDHIRLLTGCLSDSQEVNP